MSTNIDKVFILNELKRHYKLKNDAEFARFLDIKPQTLSSWYSRNTFDIELLYSKCVDVDGNFLLTGKGVVSKNEIKSIGPDDAVQRLKHEVKDLIENYSINKNSNENTQKSEIKIPLIPIEAMAGYGGGDMQVLELDCEFFTIPTFKGADFLIQVKGSSMYPKYNSGDIVACKKLYLNDLFFQWNKVYVLDTEQGALIKRIDIGPDDDHVMIVSDNEKYRPFPLHKSKINAISIVMGVIRLE